MIYSNSKPVALSLIASASLMALLTCPAQAAETSETRSVNDFTEISQNGSADVEVTIGEGLSVTVFADEEEISHILTEVDGDTLTISHDHKWRGGNHFFKHRTAPRVVITVPALEAFTSQGSGDAEIQGLDAKDFALEQEGSGDVSISGSTKSFQFRSHGSGDLDARGLEASQLTLTSQGSGDLVFSGLSASDFTFTSQGSGDLEVSGTCVTFTLDSMGSGDIEADDFVCEDVNVTSMGSANIDVNASGEVVVSIMGSGDVDVHGGGKLTHSRTQGSGDVRMVK